MKRSSGFGLIAGLGLIISAASANSQVLVESIAAIAGNEVVYLSDIENGVLDYRRSGNKLPIDELRCQVLHELLISKLFVDQARIDSITVTDDQVEADVNMRINDAIRQVGSEKALEDYFKKSMVEIRRDIRKAMVEQQVVSEVQNNISKNLSITPNDVKRYFNIIPRDSLPVVPSKVQISIIQLDPPDNEENKAEARQRLLDIRSQILAGKSFYALAVLYSEDGSRVTGGEIGYKLRGELEKPYADAAFSLTKGTVSKIVETKYGFHIIQLIDRKGDLVNTRHILIRPKVTPEQSQRALGKLDSIAQLIRKDSLKFDAAAIKYSTHLDSRINGGKFVSTNPSARINWFSLDELNKEMYVKVRDLKIGEISEPFQTTDDNGNTVFRVVKLDDEIPAHRVDLKDDYQFIYNAAMSNARQKTYAEWIQKKIGTTYIKISEEFKSCKFLEEGWLK
ncbi:MAG: peptidylprolyl isomerase [Bacteroidota bacterium]|nr:peptidylprolyl isomerase [Bacteroidota bacterium]